MQGTNNRHTKIWKEIAKAEVYMRSSQGLTLDVREDGKSSGAACWEKKHSDERRPTCDSRSKLIWQRDLWSVARGHSESTHFSFHSRSDLCCPLHNLTRLRTRSERIIVSIDWTRGMTFAFCLWMWSLQGRMLHIGTLSLGNKCWTGQLVRLGDGAWKLSLFFVIYCVPSFLGRVGVAYER